MSRFVQADETRAITAACECPRIDGKPPHAEDRVDIVADVPYGVVGQVTAAGYSRNPAMFNRFDANQKLLELTIRGWNLVGPDGREVPVDPGTIALLDATTVEWIAREVNKGYRPAVLPKASRGR